MTERTPQPEMLMDVSGLSDTELLTLFVNHRDETAFTELVQRYRRLVWSVCRRVLSDTHDIEDVFQATFLVLVRDAARIRRRPSLASWLYGVAYRLAIRVGRQADRRREVESLTSDPVANDEFAAIAQLFVRQTVDEELHSLPSKYRQPLVLHYLAGKSQKDVASEMGLTEGAVDGLLKRGRHQLRMRLARRGVTLGAVWLVLNWTEQAAQAATLAALTQTTVQAGLAYASGKTAGAVSVTALSLSGKEMVAMSFLSKSAASLVAAVCVFGLLVGGTNWLLGSNQPSRAVAPTLNTTMRQARTLSKELPAEQPVELPNELSPESNLLALANAETFEEPMPPQTATSKTPVPDERRAWDFHERSKVVQSIEDALKKQTEIAFTDTPLTDVVQFLSDYHNIPIVIDNEALIEEGVQPDLPVTRTLTGTKLESALNIILSPVLLDYVITDEVLMITTVKKAAATTEALVYDLSRIPNVEPKTVSSIIMAVTKPKDWSEKDGPGSLVLGTDFVVINHNQRTHRKIVSVLNQLERHAKEQAKRRTTK
ncbi:MAG: RNA polymerase sigma factor [Planctomycetaceae bacterium]